MTSSQPKPKPYTYLGTTAEKEGISEEAFRKWAKIVQEQSRTFENIKRTHDLVWRGNVATWEKKKMKYAKLFELIKDMSEEQKAMDVLFQCDGVNYTPTMMTQVVYNDTQEEEDLPLSQPVLV